MGMDSLTTMRMGTTSGNWISQFCTEFLFREGLVLTLIALIAGCMPTQKKRKTPQHA
jgi:hypothetical protein